MHLRSRLRAEVTAQKRIPSASWESAVCGHAVHDSADSSAGAGLGDSVTRKSDTSVGFDAMAALQFSALRLQAGVGAEDDMA
ncbi:hypothetical protein RW1_030_00930 [Rhodococcus wratislaviensis NBRC 100605]|uniref:Uncharacterized protein n=2 Tax=Rhodococcus TaxID=1827 RepID=X0Q6M7_RHOWR|nr:hypothetical protein EP51_03115 [Rhodococcus opacus]GAF46351.1 hypothetical protein RW1_030_00930 [Rhodococcus wratislaviensis NBRC 100605]